MGERPDRPDEVRRDPLGESTRDPLSEGNRDPVSDETEGLERDPAHAGDASDLAEEGQVDEVEITRVEIQQTRADMSETVDAIQEKLSPENLKEQAKDRIQEATVGRAEQAVTNAGDRARGAGSNLMETIKENPMPAALTGLGLGWLFMSASKQGGSRGSGQPSIEGRTYDRGVAPAPGYSSYDYPADYEEREGTASGSSVGQSMGRARDRAGEATSQAQDRAGQLATRAQDQASRLSDRAQDQAGDLGSRARRQARRAQGGFQRMLRENPLTVGALAVGVGSAIGLAVPQTGKEHEVMGEARDSLAEKAQEKAQETQQKIQSVAEEAQSAAKEEAENQNLTNQ